jgi:hypothetical protein
MISIYYRERKLDIRYDLNSKEAHQYTYTTFIALVDSIIPRTPLLAELYGEIMFYGALDLYTDEYMVMILNSYTIPLSLLTAEMINFVTDEYMEAKGIVNKVRFAHSTKFAKLSSVDRFQVLMLLVGIEECFYGVNFLQEYPGLISILSSINRFVMLGYYSEWFGYGTTRLETPNRRVLQYYPLSWDQVGYPGPSLSYGSYVRQYYQTINKERENSV